VSDKRIVFLHAFPCTGEMWAPQVAAVQEAGWQALAPDLPGFGAEPLPNAAPDLDVVADHVIADLDVVNTGPWVIAGVSLGGYVAMNLMRRFPKRVSAVLLCDTKATADGDQARANRERLASICEAPGADVLRVLEQAVLPGLVGTTTHEERSEVAERVRGWLASADGRSVAWYQRAMAARPDSTGILTGFTAPSLVLWGAEDALSPAEEQSLMTRALPDVREVVVPRVGHLANVEAPEIVSAAIVDFLDEVESGS